MSIANKILQLGKQLLPTGRAWRASFRSNQETLLKSLAISETAAQAAGRNILDVVIPDNDNFTEDDATQWEARLGLISNPLTPLVDRKLAILRKMAAPGRNPAKGHYLWLQQQLQDAGFTNLYVYENIYPVYPSGYTTVNPASLNANILSTTRYGDSRYGARRYGGYLNSLVANSLVNARDQDFDLGANLRASFFISAGPSTPGVYANVLATREQELRQLILNLKQTQAVAILFVNYI